MKKLIEIGLIIGLCIFMFPDMLSAQIKYKEGVYLSIGGDPNPNYGMSIYNHKGISFYGSSRFIVDYEHTFCYMKGSNWAVYFYDNDTKSYNDIRAQAILQRANGEIYDDWIDDDGGVSVLRALQPVSYRLKSDVKPSVARSQSFNADTTRHIGFIAQQVERIIPNAVSTDPDGIKCISYTRILPIAVRSVGDINNRIKNNRAKIDRIKAIAGISTINTSIP